MAASPTPPNADTPAVAVATSGGRDSTALLHCTARAARGLGLRVHALHVHHGLNPAADCWQDHLQRQCRRWERAGLPVQLQVQRLADVPPGGASVEAWARRARYEALAAMARASGCNTVLLAHHSRDQAETVLLQALRGGGARGLSAMPQAAERAGITWLRPWLLQPRSAIEAYVARHRLSHVDDDSNDDPRFARNRLRLQVWPVLEAAFPAVGTALVAVSARAQEQAACVQALAELDATACVAGDGSLALDPWLALAVPRRANLLRHWLASQCGRGVPEALLRRLLAELPATGGSWQLQGGDLRLYRRQLAFHRDAPAPQALPVQWLDLSRPGLHQLPAGQGSLTVASATHGGLASDRLRRVRLQARAGAENFQPHPARPPRSLKKQFQATGVPAWARGGPLVYGADGALLFAAGLGVDARQWATPGAPQLMLAWDPDPVA